MSLAALSADHGLAPRRAETRNGAGTPRDVLIIVHRPETNPGAVGQWLRANGYRLDVRCPRFGGVLPETLENHAGAIMFGGPMSANDPDAYIREEIDWLAVPLREEKPYFGICLGAQMLAKQLGAPVGFHPEGKVEVGYYPIEVSETARSLLAWPNRVYQWHCEGFGLPHGAERLVSGAMFENQVIRYGAAAFGVQFHPEMTLAMIHRWTTMAVHRLSQAGARPKREHIEGHDIYGAQLRAWLSAFMTLWLASGVPARAPLSAKLQNGAHSPSAIA
jgi:GMP synthase (glutamine-hydrolysing)